MSAFNTISHGRNYCSRGGKPPKNENRAYYVAGIKPGSFTNVDLLKFGNSPGTV